MRTIGAITASRSDYGIYVPVLQRIQEDPDLSLRLFVTGMHLSPEFGSTVQIIERDDFEIAERIEMLLSSDTPEGIAKSMGLGTIGFAQAYAHSHPDILLALGDRFEMHAAVVAALPFKIPVAHLHGGESTEGLIDEAIRHSITKMSHLHFVTTETYAQRVIHMGEEPWRVVVSGAPSLDNLNKVHLLSRKEIEKQFELDLNPPLLLITYHPVTLEYEQTETHIKELLAALEEVEATIIFTYPNADTGSHLIIQMIREFTDRHPRAQITVNLGTQAYFSLMNHAEAMVGNSSSGIIEAASFKLPVVNIGNRQRGRLCEKNVIHVGYSQSEILKGTQKAISLNFRASLADLTNPYGDGQAAERIVNKLKQTVLNENILLKRFYDIKE
ncbi:UDP-N-acetylglucosamine 2-epimerase [Chloroflexota bacterium]